MPLFRGTFAALQHRDYRMLWSGSLLATTAFMMSFMLVPSVAFEITGSNAAAGLAQMGSGIGMFAVAPIGGVIADRVAKKPLVLAGQIVPALVILATGVLIQTDLITVPLLTLATLIMGLGFAFMGPARQAWVGELVPRDTLPNAIALQGIAQNMSQVAAPLFIALLVGTVLDIGGAYLFMASLFVVVLPLTSLLPSTPASAKERRPIRSELMAGLAYAWGVPRLRTLWLGFVGVVVCGFAFQTLLPGLLDEELGRQPTEVGPIFLAMAVAGLAVSVPLAGIVVTRWSWPALLAMGFVMAGGFLILSIAPTYALVIVAGVPIGIGRSGFMLVSTALLMSGADRAYHGRVMSLAMMAFGSQALLAPLWGLLADAIGVRQTLAVVGVVATVVTAAVGLSWVRIRREPEPPAEPGPAPTGRPAVGVVTSATDAEDVPQAAG
ncbi:MAG: MFS transporter [Acidimicrobiia bacterium]|nr:MFS transporter [Acidimicrobiia bacterium]